VVKEGRTPHLVMTSLSRHEIHFVKVAGLYVSERIHFGLLILRTTADKSVKYPSKQNHNYPGKQNLFQINSEINTSKMFVQWIVVPNFELQIAYT